MFKFLYKRKANDKKNHKINSEIIKKIIKNLLIIKNSKILANFKQSDFAKFDKFFQISFLY